MHGVKRIVEVNKRKKRKEGEGLQHEMFDGKL